jgi:hypothetical protein
MKKIFLLVILCYGLIHAQSYNDSYLDTTRVKKVTFGDGSTWDVNLYRGSADLLKTDDVFQAVGGYNSADGTTGRTVSSGTVSFKNGLLVSGTPGTTSVHWDSITNKPAKITNFISSNYSISSNTISNTSEIVINSSGSISNNYNNSSTGIWAFYGGGASAVVSMQTNGDISTAGYYNTTDGYKLNGSALTPADLDPDLTNFPSQGGNSGKYLTTNGSALSWGTVTVANDTANMVTKATTQVISGTKYHTGDIYVDATKYIYGTSDLNLRAAGSGSIALNYNQGANLINYGGTTSVKFQSYANGNLYAAGTINAVSGYQVNGSALSYTHVGAAASSHSHTYTSMTGQTVTFNGITEASSGNEYTLVFQNGILTSYSLYP